MKEFKSKFKYRIKVKIQRDGEEAFIPQRSRFGLFWHCWYHCPGADMFYVRSYGTEQEAREFIDTEIKHERWEWEEKTVGTKIIKY